MDDVNASRDAEWYKQQWEALMNLLDTDTPDNVVESVATLQDQAERLHRQQAVLKDAGFERPELALKTIENMEQQLDELYTEKEATEQTDSASALRDDADTFDQLQALLAREEKLQRELGVSNPDAVIEMIEGMTDQLEELYVDRDAGTDSHSIFDPVPPSDAGGPDAPDLIASSPDTDAAEDTNAAELLERELGVSDPEAIVAMMNDLTDQLEELYTGRQRLAEHNLNGAEDAIAMVQSMQQQLEFLYERQEEMSKHGVDGIDYALSMIESMEAQLNELYDDRAHSDATPIDTPDPDTSSLHLDTLEEKLSTLTEEKAQLRQTRDQLQQQLNDLEEEIGTNDPDTISNLVQNLEHQLEAVYQDREQAPSEPDVSHEEPLLDADTLAQLEEMDASALDALRAGVFGLDAAGVVQHANERALKWPDVTTEDPAALQGASFFNDLAPGANSDLFRGRFQEALDAVETDEQFLYTYVGHHAPLTNLVVRLYSDSDQSRYWIVFRILE